MLNRSVLVACLLAVLAACERPQQAPVRDTAVQEPVRPAVEKHTISAAPEPEHFDRMRAEQFEKEEDRLRKRSRN